MNKKTIAVLFASSGCLLNKVNGRSYIGLQQAVKTMDQVDDLAAALAAESPEVDLQQTLEQNIEPKKEAVKNPIVINKPFIQKPKPKQENQDKQDKYHRTGMIGNDNIGTASTEDMYAFSQVLASGGNVNKAVEQLEVEAKKEKEMEKQQQNEMVSNVILAMKEANKSEEEKQLDRDRSHLHNLAVKELSSLQNNDETSALATLVDHQKLEILAEQMQGSGIDLEEQRKHKAEAEKKKKKEAIKKKQQQKQALVQKKQEAKRKALERKKKIEDAYVKLQTQHGGIDGTQDTGYDDSAMDTYLGRDPDAPSRILPPPVATENLMLNDNFEIEEYETLLIEHRNHLLSQKMTEDAQNYLELM